MQANGSDQPQTAAATSRKATETLTAGRRWNREAVCRLHCVVMPRFDLYGAGYLIDSIILHNSSWSSSEFAAITLTLSNFV